MKRLLCVAKLTSLCVEIDSSKVSRDVRIKFAIVQRKPYRGRSFYETSCNVGWWRHLSMRGNGELTPFTK